MPTSAIPDIDIIKQSIRERHLQQLSSLNLVAEPSHAPRVRDGIDNIKIWTEESKDQIEAAIKNKVYGGDPGSPIDFNNAFMAFMESASMILRDADKVVKAVESYRSVNDRKASLGHLENSTADIEKIAELWGMEFIQICDFVELHPDGQCFIVGPFCGAFIRKDLTGSIQFIGLVFKGTTVPMEIINNIEAIFTLRPPKRLWETRVSKGFYLPVFTTYGGDPENEPFALIQKAVQCLTQGAETNVITHVAGHSMGAAYATLAYAQLCIEGFGTPRASLGDLYTHGSPRTGCNDFAEKVRKVCDPETMAPNVHGSIWRIVNDQDYVPQVPVPILCLHCPFIHVDSAYRIYADHEPTLEPSEIGTCPAFTLPTQSSLEAHDTAAYYRSLKYATTGKESKPVPTGWRYHPLSLSAFSKLSANVTSLELTSTLSSSVSLHTVDSESDILVVGTIAVGHFLGEITAVGSIPAIDSQARLEFNDPESWRKIYTRNRQNTAVFTKVDQKTFDIRFVVGNVEVARARVSTADDLGDFNITRGSCVWSRFRETPEMKLAAIEKEIANAAASVFSLL